MATQDKVAKHLDLSARRLRDLIKRCVIPASKGRGGLDIEACRLAYIRNLRGIASGQVNGAAADDGGIDLERERALLTRKQAEKIQLFLDEEEGNLVRVEDVREEWSRNILNCRARLLALPTTLARDCYGAGTTAEVHDLIKKGVYEALTELANSKGNSPEEESEEVEQIRAAEKTQS